MSIMVPSGLQTHEFAMDNLSSDKLGFSFFLYKWQIGHNRFEFIRWNNSINLLWVGFG